MKSYTYNNKIYSLKNVESINYFTSEQNYNLNKVNLYTIIIKYNNNGLNVIPDNILYFNTYKSSKNSLNDINYILESKF